MSRLLNYLLIAGLSILLTSCYVGRYFWWNFADIHDDKKFPVIEVKKSSVPFYFTKLNNNKKIILPESYQKDGITDFDSFLEKNKSVAFLIIQNDTVIYENYFAGYTDASIIPSFSVSKSFISALLGIAIDEGYIYSVNQSIRFFLKELGPEFEPIKIVDLLEMRSGIRFTESYGSPFAPMARYYYGTNLEKYITKLKIKKPPGLEYDYASVNSLLLGLIIERATQTKLATYLEQKIWEPLGMESDASWSIDSEKHQTVKAFCCINAIALDFAKVGKLYLDKGNFAGHQILTKKWVQQSLTINNDSKDSQGYPYTWHWRTLTNGAFFAKGVLGQYVYVNPEKNTIIVRLGKSYANQNWVELFEKLSEQF